MSQHTNKTYRCSKCRATTIQTTNHYGPTYSVGHHNCCPKCPPWAKYPEFGGSTTWICLDLPPVHEFELDGVKYQYTELTVFKIQVGKGPKGSYEPRYTFTGNFSQAWIHYSGINVGNGYKKRLLMDGQFLCRQFS